MTASPDEIRRKIDGLDYSISLLMKEREFLWRELFREDLNRNQYACEKQTRRTAEFFFERNFLIVNLKKSEPNADDRAYDLAKNFGDHYNTIIPFLKCLSENFKSKSATFTYQTDSLGNSQENDLYNICTTMCDLKWIDVKRSDAGLNIEKIEVPKKYRNFLFDGKWTEYYNRYLIRKVLSSYASKNHVSRYNIYWNVELHELSSEEGKVDKELDIVVELNDRFYIFETKSGEIPFGKLIDNARLFDSSNSRYILCTLQKGWKQCHFEPHCLFPFPQLEKNLNDLLDKDFPTNQQRQNDCGEV